MARVAYHALTNLESLNSRVPLTISLWICRRLGASYVRRCRVQSIVKLDAKVTIITCPTLPTIFRPRRFRNGRNVQCPLSNVHCPLSIVHSEVTFSCQTALVGLWHLRVKTLIGRTRNRQSHRHRGFEPELKILFVSIRANPHRCKEIYASRSTCLAQVSAFVNVTAHMFKSDESISCAACY